MTTTSNERCACDKLVSECGAWQCKHKPEDIPAGYEFKTVYGGFLHFADGTYVERVSEDGIVSNRPLEEGEYEKFMDMFKKREGYLMRALKEN